MKIFVSGHRGMVGSAIVRQLESRRNRGELIEILTQERSELDLTVQSDVRAYLQSERPDIVILAAAKVGGIHANASRPAEFIYQNLMMEANVIHQSFEAGITRALFLGSSCIYPKDALQPMAEQALLTGVLEPTNEPYAIAKIAGIKLCESYNRQYGTDYRSVMPSNLYGPGDNFHLTDSHVLPALLRRIHDAKINGDSEVVIWGSGTPKREFLHVDDMASASIFVLDIPQDIYMARIGSVLSHINIGSGCEISILELAKAISNIVGYSGRIITDPSRPDGAARKILDTKLLNSMGWRASIELSQGIADTYAWFLSNQSAIRR